MGVARILPFSRRACAVLTCVALAAACADDAGESSSPADAGAEHAEPCDSGECTPNSDACVDACTDSPGGGAGQAGHAGASSVEAGEESGGGQAGAPNDAGEIADAQAADHTAQADAQEADQAADRADAQEADQAADQSADARDTLCEDYCVCMEQTCFAYTGYPFSDTQSCLQFCAAWSAEERTCFPAWCDEARNGSPLSQHLCEHAWGAYGLNEC